MQRLSKRQWVWFFGFFFAYYKGNMLTHATPLLVLLCYFSHTLVSAPLPNYLFLHFCSCPLGWTMKHTASSHNSNTKQEPWPHFTSKWAEVLLSVSEIARQSDAARSRWVNLATGFEGVCGESDGFGVEKVHSGTFRSISWLEKLSPQSNNKGAWLPARTTLCEQTMRKLERAGLQAYCSV